MASRRHRGAELLDGEANGSASGDAAAWTGPVHGLVVEGCSLETFIALKRLFGEQCLLVDIETPREIRMLRRLGWTERDAEFYAADDRTGPAIDRLGALADHRISNGASMEDLARQIAPLLRPGFRHNRAVTEAAEHAGPVAQGPPRSETGA
jgi:hypothetical protein